MNEFPTLGLKIDLNEILGGKQQIDKLKESYVAVGVATEAATKKANENAAAESKAAAAAAAGGTKRASGSKAAKTASAEEARVIRESAQAYALLAKISRSVAAEQRIRGQIAKMAAAEEKLANSQVEQSIKRIETARRGESAATRAAKGDVFSLIAAMIGLKTAQDAVSRSGSGSGGLIGFFAHAFDKVRGLRLGLLDLRFALAVLLGGFATGPLVQFADQMVSLEARTALYAKRQAEVPYLLEATYQTAQRARQPLEGVATLYTRLAPLADRLGRSQTEMLRVVETVAKAFTLGGAAASEATASAQQFAQALSSNRFGGDELRSVAENAPVLLAAIAEGVNKINPSLNLNAATFIKWAQAGHANSEIMVRALENAQGRIDTMFKTMPVTIGQSLSVLGNTVMKAVGDIDLAFAGLNGGVRFSQEIAKMIVGFSHFIESRAFIEGVAKALTVLGQVLSTTFHVLHEVVNVLPLFAAGLAALFIATKVAAFIEALAFSFKIYGVAMTATINLQAAAAAGARALAGAMAFLSAALPVVAIAALAYAYTKMSQAQEAAANTARSVADTQTNSINAIDAAIMRVDAYGNSTDGLYKAMTALAGGQDEARAAAERGIGATDSAMVAANARAQAEKALTIAILNRASADAVAAGAKAGASAGWSDATAFGVQAAMVVGGLPQQQGLNMLASARENTAMLRREQAAQLRMAAILKREAGGVMRMDFKPLKPEAGSGVSDLPGAANKAGHGLDGAINKMAKLRAETEGLEARINAIVGEPLNALADLSERIAAAGDEAAAGFTAGKGKGFADEARMLAGLKEEAAIRLELIKGLADEARAQRDQASAIGITAQARERSTAAMLAYYSGADRSASGYLTAIRAQSDAETDAAIRQKELDIAQRYGVTTIDGISQAYQAATGATAAHGDQIQHMARVTLDAAANTIRLTAAEQARNQADKAAIEWAKQASDLESYATALEGGAESLAAYNRELEIKNMLEQAGKGADEAAVRAAADRLRAARARPTELMQATLDAEMTAHLSGLQKETEVRSLIVAIMAQGLSLSEAEAKVRSNSVVRELALRKQMAEVSTQIQDDIRKGFIETGKFNFKGVKDSLGKAIRQAIYDNLLAKPIQIVVDAIVNVVTKGLEAILSKLGGGPGGDIFQSLSNIFSPSGAAGQWLGSLGSIGSSVSAGVSTLAAGLPQIIASGMVAAQVASMFGADQRQQTGAAVGAVGGATIGMLVGGPLGAMIGAILGGLAGAIGIGKESNHAAKVNFTDDYQSFTVGGNKANGNTTAAATEAAQAITDLADAMGQFGIDASGIISSIEVGERDASYLNLANGQVVRTPQGDIEALVKAAGLALLANAKYEDPHMGELVDQMVAANKSFEQIAKMLEKYVAAQAAFTDIKMQLLKFTDPAQYTLQSLQASQLERRTQLVGYANQGFYTDEQLAALEANLTALESAEISDALNQLAEAGLGAAASLRQLQDAQAKIAEYLTGLLTGALSPLSPTAQLAQSQSDFQSMLTAAQGGDLNALNGITGSASDYLSAAQQYYGSSPEYAAIFQQVYDQLNALATQDLQDPIVAALEEQIALLIAAINAGNLSLIAAITGVEPPVTPPVVDPGTDDPPVDNPVVPPVVDYVPTPPVDPWDQGSQPDVTVQRVAAADVQVLADTMAAGFESVNQTLAAQTEAVVNSNDNGFAAVSSAMTDQGSLQVALAGGAAAAV